MTTLAPNSKQSGWVILILWILAWPFGLLFGSILGVLLLFPEAMSVHGGVDALAVFGDKSIAGSSSMAAIRAVIGAMGGAGALIGTMQWLIMRRYFYRSGWWVLASALGLAIALTLDGAIGGVVVGIFGGVVVGLSQWLVIRRFVYKAGWWVLASVIGWVAGLALGRGASWLPFGIVYGVITGSTLIWLLRFPKPNEIERNHKSQPIVKKRPSWVSGVALGCWLTIFFTPGTLVANGFQNTSNTALQFLVATLALAAGIGLWRMKKWGALLWIAYMFATLLNIGGRSGQLSLIILLVFSSIVGFYLWRLWKLGELT